MLALVPVMSRVDHIDYNTCSTRDNSPASANMSLPSGLRYGRSRRRFRWLTRPQVPPPPPPDPRPTRSQQHGESHVPPFTLSTPEHEFVD